MYLDALQWQSSRALSFLNIWHSFCLKKHAANQGCENVRRVKR